MSRVFQNDFFQFGIKVQRLNSIHFSISARNLFSKDYDIVRSLLKRRECEIKKAHF